MGLAVLGLAHDLVRQIKRQMCGWLRYVATAKAAVAGLCMPVTFNWQRASALGYRAGPCFHTFFHYCPVKS